MVLLAASIGVAQAFAGPYPDLGPVVDLSGPSVWLEMSRQLRAQGIAVSFEGLNDPSSYLGTPTAHWLQGSTDHERVAGAVAALIRHEGRARGALVTYRGYDIIVATQGHPNPLDEMVRWNGKPGAIGESVEELTSAMALASGCTVVADPPNNGKTVAIGAGPRTARDVLVDLIEADGRGELNWSLSGMFLATGCYWVLNVDKTWTAKDREYVRGAGAQPDL